MKNNQSGKDKKKLKSRSKEIFDALVIAVIAAIFLKIFFIEAYRIPTGSMEQTLLVGDFLLVNKFVYGATTPRNIPFTDKRISFFRFPALKEPHKGDVVVFNFPGNRDELESKEITMYVKRCIGEPGDTVQIKNRVVYVNGKVFSDPPLAQFAPGKLNTNITEPRIFPKGSGWNEDNYGPLAVPKKSDVIKLTMDNFDMWKVFIYREGHTPRTTVDDKITIDDKETNEYTVQKNYYFMMGDNRSNSSDSRFWGFVPDDDLVGEALIIYWSWDPNIPFSQLSSLFQSIRWYRIGTAIK
jgi:signal peptidase I